MKNTGEHSSYFIDLERAPRFTQMEGLETTVLTGLHGERMMMALHRVSLVNPEWSVFNLVFA